MCLDQDGRSNEPLNPCQEWISLRSRRLEVVGTRKNGCARRRHARGEGDSPLACLPRAPVLSFAHNFQAPATQAKSGFIGSFNLSWSEWSRITDPDPNHLKGTHPLISKKVARNVSANHKEELCKTRTITELSPQSVETVQNATRSSNR